MGNNTNKWPEGDEELRQLAKDGYSASEIARRIGRTRNSVISRCHRQNIKFANSTLAPKRGCLRSGYDDTSATAVPKVLRTPNRGRLFNPRPTPIAPEDARPSRGYDASLFQGAGVAIMDVREGQCRWPLNDPESGKFGFCGCTATRGDYCDAHARKAFQPRQQHRDHGAAESTDAVAKGTFQRGHKAPEALLMDHWL